MERVAKRNRSIKRSQFLLVWHRENVHIKEKIAIVVPFFLKKKEELFAYETKKKHVSPKPNLPAQGIRAWNVSKATWKKNRSKNRFFHSVFLIRINKKNVLTKQKATKKRRKTKHIQMKTRVEWVGARWNCILRQSFNTSEMVNERGPWWVIVCMFYFSLEIFQLSFVYRVCRCSSSVCPKSFKTLGGRFLLEPENTTRNMSLPGV